MRKIFCDLGSWDGTSVRYFRKHYDPNHEYEVICFEPLPENIEKLNKIEGITIIPSAVSYYYGKALFYTGLSQSGSLYKAKRTGGLDGKTAIEVDVISFPEWFMENIVHESAPYVPEITIKMNIEGAEYAIIDSMDHLGLLPFVNRWFINWHYAKCGIAKETHDRISGLIKSEPWKAMIE